MLSLSLALLVAAPAIAAEGYLSKTASQSNLTTVYFPGGTKPMQLVNLDVTSDVETGTVTWAVASGINASVAIAAAGTVTNLVCFSSTLASNETVLMQNASEAVAENIVFGRGSSTNKSMTLLKPLGVAVAVGDVVREKITTATATYALLAPSAVADTIFTLANPVGLAADDFILASQPLPAQTVTGAVSVIVTTACKTVIFSRPAPRDLAVGTTLRERETNNTQVSVAFAYTTNILRVTQAEPFAPDDPIVIETPNGEIEINGVSATNVGLITLTQACGFACPVLTTIHTLTDTIYTNTLPTAEGTTRFVSATTNDLWSGDTLLVTPVTGAGYRTTMTSGSTASNVYTVALTEALATNLSVGATFYKLTNSLRVALAAATNGWDLVLSNSTGLASGDTIVITPEAGGIYENIVGSTPASYVLDTVEFFSALGQTMSVGDNVYKLGTADSTTIGIATLRLNGAALRVADQRLPVKVQVIGTNATSINSATVKYGP